MVFVLISMLFQDEETLCVMRDGKAADLHIICEHLAACIGLHAELFFYQLNLSQELRQCLPRIGTTRP